MTQISIVLPVASQVQLTRRCLDSLLAGTSIARELIVIDNHSTDATPGVLNEYAVKFREQGWEFFCLKNAENVGFGRACNQGLAASHGDFVTVLRNDVWLMPGWDAVLLRRIQHLRVDMVGPHIDESPFDPVRIREKASHFVRKNHGKVSKDWVSTLMFFRREALQALGVEDGPFDERFSSAYEDTDLRYRMEKAGMTYRQVADCYIWRFSGHRAGNREKTEVSSAYEEDLKLFIGKWGFDPLMGENTRKARFHRRWKKFKKALGLF
ncbi:MAG TPA: hypothetical protein DCS07_04235 [Bdellovibrionales bacterium]|nr:MAG: hypothetical protein A2Z97_06405 [Bdellovibrionales bacterium GWB1_52_6]OFZ02502.1 MAG: hypothetical protein A2X97_07520 [Bdellovibrionales bacterium GWA1_52_35]OFZ40334.1 MAG: hypothetical protein A2070_11695 [Bdellovibrionales bacterium GWC1_52_8]HAR41827.1 hypothetical protein [Bdellovibrionales bacterium]HCM41347.1 hypothetical protein [Bdellovibrionales bacterium]